MTWRHALSWKSLFYHALLPALARAGPDAGDRVLSGLGLLFRAWPPHRRSIARAVARGKAGLEAPWDHQVVERELAIGSWRGLARDYLLEGTSERELASRFTVDGLDNLSQAIAGRRGAILLGCHLGAHLAGVHWLARQGLPVKLMVQRPKHVSPTLHRWLDRDPDSRLAQRHFFLKRHLEPAEAIRRIFLARDALRSGELLYLNGDVPWPTASALPGRLLGSSHQFLTLWCELAIPTRTAVVPVFCTHEPAGRYRLQFDPPQYPEPGQEQAALDRYLLRLEQLISAHPGDATPHLLWPSYNNPKPAHFKPTPSRPNSSRRPPAGTHDHTPARS